ncbi:MAG: nickel-dependent hydrogenase large subunit [Acidobacteria bacterium]|nr:nickel-dependent hydrogenase large subunit [Acidobacteriota bacterium]
MASELRFDNLPIRSAAEGGFSLCEGVWPEPFVVANGAERREQARLRAQVIQELRQKQEVQTFEVSTLTQTSGGLGLYSVVDLVQRKVWDARLSMNLLREYEPLLLQRHPSDAPHFASRACGRDSGAQTIASIMALEMAYGVVPPPLVVLLRNLGQSAELIANNLYSLFMLSGPDYSEAVMSRTNPALWRKAQQSAAPGALLHGMPTIASIMLGLNRLQGHLHSEAWQLLRTARELTAILFGKYPHPTTLYPGGIGIVADKELFTQVLGRLNQLVDFAKRVLALWNDLINFLLESEPRFKRLGQTRANLLSAGLWDNPQHYDASYENCSAWGEHRWLTPGVVIGGALRTTRLAELNLGVEEFVEHSYYQPWAGDYCDADPAGAPLSPYHPWNKQTLPQPATRAWLGRYSWLTAPRWDRETVETGALAQLWITALADRLTSEFIQVTQQGLEIELPKFQLPAFKFCWQLPAQPNTLERVRARAAQTAYTAMAAFEMLLQGFDYLRRPGKHELSVRYHVPKAAMGVGFWESGRGPALHHLLIAEGKLLNYQLSTPQNWLASPRDCYSALGAIEAALLNTPILEEFTEPDEFTGIDLMRTIRSFDP